MPDLLFRAPQQVVPDVPHPFDVLPPRDVAVGLEDVPQGEAAVDGLQHLPGVAEGRPGLGPGARPQQLHGAGDQGDLTRAEHTLAHLVGGEAYGRDNELSNTIQINTMISTGLDNDTCNIEIRILDWLC